MNQECLFSWSCLLSSFLSKIQADDPACPDVDSVSELSSWENANVCRSAYTCIPCVLSRDLQTYTRVYITKCLKSVKLINTCWFRVKLTYLLINHVDRDHFSTARGLSSCLEHLQISRYAKILWEKLKSVPSGFWKSMCVCKAFWRQKACSTH